MDKQRSRFSGSFGGLTKPCEAQRNGQDQPRSVTQVTQLGPHPGRPPCALATGPLWSHRVRCGALGLSDAPPATLLQGEEAGATRAAERRPGPPHLPVPVAGVAGEAVVQAPVCQRLLFVQDKLLQLHLDLRAGHGTWHGTKHRDGDLTLCPGKQLCAGTGSQGLETGGL